MRAHNLRPRTIDEYVRAITTLRRLFPDLEGPSAVTADTAKEFKIKRMGEGLAPRTVQGNLDNLSIVWSRWFIAECSLVSSNPWGGVERPRADRPDPRYLRPDEEEAFLKWLESRWPSWKLPVLFFRVKGLLGCRITELCALPTANLKDDNRLLFEAPSTKGRRTRWAVLPAEVHQELRDYAGPVFVWERYSADLRAIHRAKKLQGYVKDFTPARLRRWLQHQVEAYNEENKGVPGFRPFTAHDLRATSMTRAWAADIPLDKAATAFGCNVDTMRKHYIRLDEVAVAEEVFTRIQSRMTEGRK